MFLIYLILLSTPQFLVQKVVPWPELSISGNIWYLGMQPGQQVIQFLVLLGYRSCGPVVTVWQWCAHLLSMKVNGHSGQFLDAY